MPLTIQDSRILIKTSSVTTEVPTVAPSNDHTDGTWSVVNIYSGELFLNTADKKIWFRAGSSIVEVATKISNQKNTENYNVTSGTDTYTVGLTPALTSYSVGGTYSIKFGNTNTGASTINIDSLGAVPLIMGGTAVGAGDIIGGVVYLIVYDGTNFHITGGGGGATVNFDDSTFTIYDNSDNTKIVNFQVSGVSTGTTRTLTVPNASGTIALTSDLSGYQPLDANLTSWASVTRASGFDTFAATPSSANLISLLTDEVGSGKAVFNNAPNFDTSITANYATASTIAIFDGSKNLITASTATYPSLTELSYIKGLASSVKNREQRLVSAAVFNPADSTTYNIGPHPTLAPGTSNRYFSFENVGTVTKVVITTAQLVDGSNETIDLYLRNQTTATDYSLGTFTLDKGVNGVGVTAFTPSISIANTTDTWTIKMSTPAWATNPTSVYTSVRIINVY